MKLWDKGYSVDSELEAFTTADDYLLDRDLVAWDCAASVAHARMLARCGILSDDEAEKLATELRAIAADAQAGSFEIKFEDEDCHTAIEKRLTARLGDLGKKIHTCRSRNDQVIAALRLWAKDALHTLFAACLDLATTLRQFAEAHKDIPMVGRTHTQVAMPSSVGDWLAAHRLAFATSAQELAAASLRLKHCPLGSGAGYGVPLPLARDCVARALGFEGPEEPVTAAQRYSVAFIAAGRAALEDLFCSSQRD